MIEYEILIILELTHYEVLVISARKIINSVYPDMQTEKAFQNK